MRSFTLPRGRAGDKMSAEFKDGVLEVPSGKDLRGKAEIN